MGNNVKVRTRFAPSPTGMMHIGNLRTALYAYLISKSQNGDFVLRIEDTDRGRLVEGSVDVIYSTLKSVGLNHDEGPDIGGEYGPYIQSQRKDIYPAYAHRLVQEGKAYYCFCAQTSNKHPEDSENLFHTDNSEDSENLFHTDSPDDSEQSTAESSFQGYNRHCRDLTEPEIKKHMDACHPYVIRQKMPLTGKTTFVDQVYGKITIDNEELEDQILIKSDGFPTYNFANVIDDYLMNITHVIRGSEYLTSTPKYNLLYDAFGWRKPEYIHLPLIMGKNTDGTVAKLSKRHGSTGYDDLIKEGYLKEAILNYIVLLGWSPGDNVEMMSLEDMVSKFNVKGISKSPAIFDYDKLKWFNSEYIKNMNFEDFYKIISNDLKSCPAENLTELAKLLQTRIHRLTEVKEMINFIEELPQYSPKLFTHKKMKTDTASSLQYLTLFLPELEIIKDWTNDVLYNSLVDFATSNEIKNGQIMWPVRTALSGQASSPGGAVELLHVLGKDESIKRIKYAIELLSNDNS